ncbi:MAG: DUF6282 family protein [Armatimonadota bacterium]|nr:DUF6282 family protein [Armatimonadota bacterium]MDR7486806.1 DUF6282 family protein [Armatimonadota bacterium]MDR7533855.1 DUF6282 family protein [Armatimonadota bacterium]MDR7535103.1 DUF6282 family protein [Armatimonadota bacterium]
MTASEAPGAEERSDTLARVRDETEGMIDFHVHTAPDNFDRTVDAVEATRAARALGMRAIVLKGGAFETVTRAAQARTEVGGGIDVFGGVVLNWPMGGINAAAVEAMVAFRGAGAAGLGRVVWLPSINARNHHERFGIPQPGVEVFNGTRLVPAMGEILAMCAEYGLVLQTGHLSPSEALAVIREARAAGVERIVCTHADYDPINMTIEEQRQVARLGAYIEHAYIGVFLGPDSPVERFRTWRGASVEQMAMAIKAVGAERCILASDLGASPCVTPAEGFLAFVRGLRTFGITDRELDLMGRRTPAQLLEA